MNFQHTFSVIGIGEVGSTVCTSLLSAFSNSLIHAFDIAEDIEGRLLDLSHAAATFDNELIINNKDVLEASDFIFYCAGYGNAKGESRNSVAKENYNLVHEIFSNLKLKANAIVIVITNPVELVSRWVFEALERSNLVVGTGTYLDSLRLKTLVANAYNIPNHDVNIPLIGEHGPHMVCYSHYASIYGKELDKTLNEHELYDYIEEVKASASEIRKTEKATKFGVSLCAISIVKAFLSNEKTLIPLSVLVTNEISEQLDCDEHLFISLLVEINNEESHLVSLAHLSEQEIMDLKVAAKQLQNLHYHILH